MDLLPAATWGWLLANLLVALAALVVAVYATRDMSGGRRDE